VQAQTVVLHRIDGGANENLFGGQIQPKWIVSGLPGQGLEEPVLRLATDVETMVAEGNIAVVRLAGEEVH
jgi:hypothetical protein